MPRRALALLLCLVPLAAALQAQAPRYAWSRADTMRYEERTDGTVSMAMPQGPVEVVSVHHARVGMTGHAADTVRAWFDSLHLANTFAGQPPQAPPTAALLRAPYTLVMTPRGGTTTVGLPAFPEEVAAITDLSYEFHDFLITLPAGPLRAGAEWADTLERSPPRTPGARGDGVDIRSYRVVGDTVVDGQRAVRIATRGTYRLAVTSPMEAQRMTVTSTLAGADEGEALFAPATGRLLARRRTGELRGELVIEGGGRRITAPQTYRYEHRIALVR